VLIAAGEGRKDGQTKRVSGRAPDNRLVHVALDPRFPDPRPGDIASATITHGAPHHLVADILRGVRRTTAGDNGVMPIPPMDRSESEAESVLIGMPTIR